MMLKYLTREVSTSQLQTINYNEIHEYSPKIWSTNLHELAQKKVEKVDKVEKV